jgi:hypothetical protein
MLAGARALQDVDPSKGMQVFTERGRELEERRQVLKRRQSAQTKKENASAGKAEVARDTPQKAKGPGHMQLLNLHRPSTQELPLPKLPLQPHPNHFPIRRQVLQGRGY